MQTPPSENFTSENVRDLRLALAGIVAVLASLPQTAEADPEQVRRTLESLIDPKADIIRNDQIARAMHFAQTTLALARDSHR